jgi:uncharacterized protein (DUF952 family)
VGTSSIFHMAEPVPWEQARAEGWYAQSTRGATLADVGFIHCSFRHQVETVANHIYGDWDGPLLLLEVNPDEVPAEIRIESLDGGPEAFPHIYGPLPTTAVTAVHSLVMRPSGWRLPAEL